MKLSDEHRQVVIDLAARMVPDQQIADHLRREYGVEISRQGISALRLRKGMAARISKAKDEWLYNLAEVPMFHAKVRLLAFQAIYDEARREGARSTAIEALRQAREEAQAINDRIPLRDADKAEVEAFLSQVATFRPSDMGGSSGEE